MKYLDENIQLTVTGITVVQKSGTYPYVVKNRNNTTIFAGNTFLNVGETHREFDITDIISNYKWKATDIKKPLSNNTASATVIDQYHVELTIPYTTYDSASTPTITYTTYSSELVDVAFVYRYPNRKNALEATLVDTGTTTGITLQNCLQGAINGVYGLYPHIPYKLTNEYGFGFVFEALNNGSYSTVNTTLSLDGQLYYDTNPSVNCLAPTGVNFRTLNALYSGITESHYIQPTYSTSGWTKETEVEDRDLFYTVVDADEPPIYLYVWTGDRAIGYFKIYNGTVKFDIDNMVQSDGGIFMTADKNLNEYVHLSSNELIGKVHVSVENWLAAGNQRLFIEPKVSKGDVEQDETHLNINLHNRKIGEKVYADSFASGVTYGQAVQFLINTLHYVPSRADEIAERISINKNTLLYSGSTEEVEALLPSINTIFGNVYTEDILGDKPEPIAIIDKGCLSKYYLMWQDRYGGIQSQPFEKTETFSIDYKYDEMKDYQNFRRNVTIEAQPKWKIQTNWIDEEYYPYYESIFVSPYLLLYDTEEDKSYNVIAKGTNYTEKTWKNQHKFFNLELEVEQTKLQNILY